MNDSANPPSANSVKNAATVMFWLAFAFHLAVALVGLWLMKNGWTVANDGQLIAGAILVGSSQVAFMSGDGLKKP
jgi:hypothetical protein